MIQHADSNFNKMMPLVTETIILMYYWHSVVTYACCVLYGQVNIFCFQVLIRLDTCYSLIYNFI